MHGWALDWAALRAPRDEAPAEGLRERKKRETRRLLVNTATELFLARGFDAVRVADVAEAAGVSEKTVFNYFPAKEALILDRPDATLAALRAELGDPRRTPVEAVLRILAAELAAVTAWLDDQGDRRAAATGFHRYGELIRSTPALAAYQRDLRDELADGAARLLAERSGRAAADPEPQLAATALVALWRVQFASLARHIGGAGATDRTPARLRGAVTTDVLRAARLLESGVGSFARTRRPAGKDTAPPTTRVKNPAVDSARGTKPARPARRSGT
ncbi:TetR family transcriptional regulator [Amycolatopsis rhabdoformis]|uniref:TetR family transcriptional regulator n=1 Tax=Amycolatopsis rhabdoformis TaxID=1448059 RepID=A0ABZ1IBJ8_9PSEU|nr:TetR family transcriptional regulator [Amycolatopsis rhabdoformis]WSE31844.1 TetR family transcriptional regulator [Amycolatopsis rhabdoformis]